MTDQYRCVFCGKTRNADDHDTTTTDHGINTVKCPDCGAGEEALIHANMGPQQIHTLPN